MELFCFGFNRVIESRKGHITRSYGSKNPGQTMLLALGIGV